VWVSIAREIAARRKNRKGLSRPVSLACAVSGNAKKGKETERGTWGAAVSLLKKDERRLSWAKDGKR